MQTLGHAEVDVGIGTVVSKVRVVVCARREKCPTLLLVPVSLPSTTVTCHCARSFVLGSYSSCVITTDTNHCTRVAVVYGPNGEPEADVSKVPNPADAVPAVSRAELIGWLLNLDSQQAWTEPEAFPFHKVQMLTKHLYLSTSRKVYLSTMGWLTPVTGLCH